MNVASLFFKLPRPKNEATFIERRAPIRGNSFLCAPSFTERTIGDHIYLERGSGRPLIFCAGLAGSIDNIFEIGLALSEYYRFIVPYLPIYDLPLAECTIPRLGDYLETFLEDLGLEEAIFIGSSMGGGASLHYALRPGHRAKGLVLCGSSGLSTIPMQKGFLRRKDFSYVKGTVEDVFFNPGTPSINMIREVYDAIQKTDVALRFIRFTRSTANDQLHDRLHGISVPCLLVWGMQDRITPFEIAGAFHELLPDSDLHYVDQCGHVPTQERPGEVLCLIRNFLNKINY